MQLDGVLEEWRIIELGHRIGDLMERNRSGWNMKNQEWSSDFILRRAAWNVMCWTWRKGYLVPNPASDN